MGLSLRGQTSGAVDINAPDVAGDNTITLPGGNGSANQFYKNSDTAGIITHSSMTESSSGVISIGDIDINGTTRTITTGVGQTVGFSTDIKIQGSVRIEDPSVSVSRLAITYQGIDFQNTGAGSSSTATAHLLDDYEEGTWTPTLSGGATASAGTMSGNYVKVGNIVHAAFNLTNSTIAGAPHTGIIQGLPYANSGDRAGGFGVNSYNAMSSANQTCALITANSSDINLLRNAASGPWIQVGIIAGSNRYFNFVCTYRTS